ncbi:MAG: PilZ domain-containing protein [Bacillota bacterium]
METKESRNARIAERLRQSERVQAEVPVHQRDRRIATTRDLSPTGIYFVGEGPFSVGDEIEYSLEFENPNGPIVVECRGRVVRVEDIDGKIGVGIHTLESRLIRKAE